MVAFLGIVVIFFNSGIIAYTRFKILLDSKLTSIYDIDKNIDLVVFIRKIELIF